MIRTPRGRPKTVDPEEAREYDRQYKREMYERMAKLGRRKWSPIVNLTCAWCKLSFERRQNWIDNQLKKNHPTLYCSKSCSNHGRYFAKWPVRQRAKPLPKLPKLTVRFETKPRKPAELTQLICKHCGMGFTRRASVIRSGLTVTPNAGSYCSRSCSGHAPHKRDPNPNRIRKPRKPRKSWAKWLNLVCVQCGAAFTTKASVVKNNKKTHANAGSYCSRQCSIRAGRGACSLSRLKRQPGWSDEQWLWERRLAEDGLGMGVGTIPKTTGLYDNVGLKLPARKTNHTSFGS